MLLFLFISPQSKGDTNFVSCLGQQNRKESFITMTITYKTQGVCSEAIDFRIENNKIYDVTYTKGCNGNSKGIGALTTGMEVSEAIKRLEGIKCGDRETSCPDQLAKALKQVRL